MKASIRYRVSVLDPNQHLYGITLEIDQPAARQRLSLPVWIPGSYLVREFAQHLQRLQASIAGQPVALEQLDKNSWEARLPAGSGKAPLELRYDVTVTELVGWEHSMKNELILARRLQPARPAQQARARERLQAILDELGLQPLAARFALPAEPATA